MLSPTIPRTLHQTWKTDELPPELRQFRQSWLDHHPDWEHRLWTDAENRAFVAREYPAFLPTYDGYDETIKRVDAVRYLLLHHYGGVYADLDTECVQPLTGLLANRAVVIGREPASHEGLSKVRERGLRQILCNAVMASVPGHPFWLHVLAALMAARDEPLVLDATGPFVLTRAYESYSDGAGVTVLGPEAFYPRDVWEVRDGSTSPADRRAQLTDATYVMHHWAGTWRREQVLRLARERVLARRRPPPPGAD